MTPLKRNIPCQDCQAPNDAESKFCAQCGHKLPEDLADKLREENTRLLADGRRLLSENRLAEARVVAESVLESEQENPEALALLADISEREGDAPAALELYERVVELRKDTPLDRIRVAHLRKIVAAQEILLEQPDERKRNLLVAALAGVFLVCVSSAVWIASQPAPAIERVALNENPAVESFRSFAPPPVPGQLGTAPTNPGQTNAPTLPSGTAANPAPNQPPANDNPARNADTIPNRIGFSGAAGSSAPAGSINPDGPVPPFDPGVRFVPSPPQNQNQQPQDESRPTPQSPPPPADSPATEEPPPGIIQIEVRNSNSPRVGGGGAAPAQPDSREAFVERARDLFVQEDYAGAAAAYEQAIRLGQGGGAVFQRLAQCYEKLGRRPQAINAYRRAINAFEAQIANGQGNDRIRTALDACRRALAALGG